MTQSGKTELRDFKFGHLLIRVKFSDRHGSTFGIHVRTPEGQWKPKAEFSGVVEAGLATEARLLAGFLNDIEDGDARRQIMEDVA